MPPAVTIAPIPRTFDATRAPHLFYASAMPDAVRLDTSNPKWIQLCTAGSYVYRGQPVTISEQDIDRMIANFRASPAYKPDGRALFGKETAEATKLVLGAPYGVIALNFDHPPMGGPRPGHGWFVELERRGGEFWGLCWFDAEAHAGMIAGSWKWTSIEWAGSSVNNQGEEVGAYLSGVALTNDPFITGMIPIQMSARTSGPVVWFGPAADVLRELRCAFGLPETADVGAVISEVAKLRAWALGQTPAPIGVNVGELVGRIRCLLALPTLTEPATIFGELDKLLGRLADEQQEEETMNVPIAPNVQPAGLGLARLFAARLSALLRSPVTDDEPSLVKAFDGMTGRYDEAMGLVANLQKMLDTTDPKVLADKLAQLMALADQMSSLLGEVQQEAAAADAAEVEMAAGDVAQVMAAQRLDPVKAPGTLKAYTAQRLGFSKAPKPPTLEEFKAKPATLTNYFAARRAWLEGRAGASKAFYAEHGITAIIPVPAEHQHLYGRALFAGPGAVFGVENVGAPPTPQEQGAPQHFSQGYQGAQLGNGPPPQPGGWSWARVAQLPPASNYLQRIADEVNRVEFGSKGSSAAINKRANEIANDISRRDGQPPASLLTGT